MYALRPGMYVVKATAKRTDDPPLGFGRTYYPGTMNEAEAQTCPRRSREEAVANFSMIPARLARVAGVVRDSEGRPVSAGGSQWATVLESNDRIDVPTGGDGGFSFEKVLPGRYLLHVRPSAGERQPCPRHLSGPRCMTMSPATIFRILC